MITYNVNIPDTPNNPSNDQPLMKTNTNAIQTILGIDHVNFNVTNPPDGGTHKQVTFSTKNAPVAQTEPQSVLYTDSGTASTVADMRFRNQNGIFPVNAIKAFGVFTTTAVNGAVALDMGMNVSSITASAAGQTYTVALTANAVNGTTVIVFTNLSNDGAQTWSFAANTLTLGTNAGSTGARKYSFAILQV